MPLRILHRPENRLAKGQIMKKLILIVSVMVASLSGCYFGPWGDHGGGDQRDRDRHEDRDRQGGHDEHGGGHGGHGGDRGEYR